MQWRIYVAVLIATLVAFLAQDFIAGYVQVQLPFNFGLAAVSAIFAVAVFALLKHFVLQ